MTARNEKGLFRACVALTLTCAVLFLVCSVLSLWLMERGLFNDRLADVPEDTRAGGAIGYLVVSIFLIFPCFMASLICSLCYLPTAVVFLRFQYSRKKNFLLAFLIVLELLEAVVMILPAAILIPVNPLFLLHVFTAVLSAATATATLVYGIKYVKPKKPLPLADGEKPCINRK